MNLNLVCSGICHRSGSPSTYPGSEQDLCHVLRDQTDRGIIVALPWVALSTVYFLVYIHPHTQSHRLAHMYTSEIRSDCVGGVLARSCSDSDADLRRQPGIPRRVRRFDLDLSWAESSQNQADGLVLSTSLAFS